MHQCDLLTRCFLVVPRTLGRIARSVGRHHDYCHPEGHSENAHSYLLVP